MRITALLAAASVVFVLTACQKAEDKADATLTEAVEAAGVPDPGAADATAASPAPAAAAPADLSTAAQ